MTSSTTSRGSVSTQGSAEREDLRGMRAEGELGVVREKNILRICSLASGLLLGRYSVARGPRARRTLGAGGPPPGPARDMGWGDHE